MGKSGLRRRLADPDPPVSQSPAPDTATRTGTRGMPVGRLLLVTFVVSALFAAVTTIVADFVIPWSTPINIPAMPLENWRSMPEAARDNLLRSGTIQVKSVQGAEKAVYILRAAPMQIVNDWLWFMLPAFAAALACGWLGNRRR